MSYPYDTGSGFAMNTETTVHGLTDLDLAESTLIEGFPGHGLVASITVDEINDQLGLEPSGSIRSTAFPPAASFTNGVIQDPIRVYAGSKPPVVTLLSDLPVPEEAFSELSQCVLKELATEVRRAIFVAGAPTQSNGQRETVTGIGTTERLRDELADAGIDIQETGGLVSGVTGALVSACYQADVPAVMLLVPVDPRLPDPKAAHEVIENALEPFVEFDIDTSNLLQKAEEIQQQKQQIADQLQQANDLQDEPLQAESMFR